MKKIVPVLFAAFLLFVAFSCDKVKNPIVPKSTVVGSDFVTKNNFDVSDSKKTLLEDYTGMKCNNCPRAARLAEDMVETTYHDDLIIIAVHSGAFATPDGSYKNDFRTNIGDAWKADLSVFAYPSGIINRKDYASNGSIVVAESKWQATTALAFNDPLVIKLNVTTNYDTIVGALNVDVDGIFKKPYQNALKISVLITEGGIIGKQLDKDASGHEFVVDEYEYNHMLRGTMNGDWGTDLTTSASKVKDTASVSFKDFDLKNGLKYTIPNVDPKKAPTVKPILVNDKNVAVVVFAYDAVTKEVLQVERVKIR